MKGSTVYSLERIFKHRAAQAQYQAHLRTEAVLKAYPEIAETEAALRLITVQLALGDNAQKNQLKAERHALNIKYEAQLKAAGINADDLKPKYACPLCSDTGRTPQGRCACFKRELFSLLYADADIKGAENESFDAFSLDVFPEQVPEGYKLTQRQIMSRVKAQLQAYAEQFPENTLKNAVILGQTGTGKTFLLNCIAKAVIEKGYSVLRLSSYRLFELMFEHFIPSAEGKRDLTPLFDIDLLLIDDLGAETFKQNFTVEYLFMLINERSRREKHTVVTSNLAYNDMLERYTERVTSRLFDRSRALLINIPGRDIRMGL